MTTESFLLQLLDNRATTRMLWTMLLQAPAPEHVYTALALLHERGRAREMIERAIDQTQECDKREHIATLLLCLAWLGQESDPDLTQLWGTLRGDISVFIYDKDMSRPNMVQYGSTCKAQALNIVHSEAHLYVEWHGTHACASCTGDYPAVVVSS